MNAAQEAAFEQKAEQMLRGHRGLQSGRDFRWNTFRYQKPPREVVEKFDRVFPNAPDGPGFWKRYCRGCGKLSHFCQCGGKGS